MSTLDRDAAREALRGYYGRFTDAREGMALTALEGCVRPAPEQTIDRDVLEQLLLDLRWQLTRYADPADRTAPIPESATRWAERILALSRPGDGAILTREEARIAADAIEAFDYRAKARATKAWVESNFMRGPNGDRMIAEDEALVEAAAALQRRLEAAS